MAAERVSSEATAGAAATPSGSPRNKVKFLCSHGGKILPRPADGELKYVGGETRIVSIPRDITFSDLTKKLASISDLDTVLKYQLLHEDLDTLVTVKSDEDLRHMLEECDRYQAAGSPMLRAFLFRPNNPLRAETSHMSPIYHPQVLEQRYIDAVNGIIRPLSPNIKQPFLRGDLTPLPLSSTSSSPKSPRSLNMETVNHETTASLNPYRKNPFRLPKVRSSPSIFGLHGHLQSNQQYSYHHHHRQKHPHHIIRTPSPIIRQPFLRGDLTPIPLSSTSSSPKSPHSLNMEMVNHETTASLNPIRNNPFHLPKVRSSPSICGLHGHSQSNHQYGHHHQKPPHRQHVVHRHLRSHPVEPSVSVRSLGRPDSWKYQVVQGPWNHFHQ